MSSFLKLIYKFAITFKVLPLFCNLEKLSLHLGRKQAEKKEPQSLLNRNLKEKENIIPPTYKTYFECAVFEIIVACRKQNTQINENICCNLIYNEWSSKIMKSG